LTGKPPFAGDDVGLLLRAVQKGEFPPPRVIDPRIDKALEIVCLKAMATRPEDRYPSAKALADDIERWLADEAVTAWREPWSVRARRWVARNRTMVGAVMIAAPVAIVSLSTIVAHERLTNSQLAANNRELALASQAANRSRRRAEQRENMALQAIDNYRKVVETNPDLLTRADLKPLRQRLLDAPLGFYRSFRDALVREKNEPSPSLALDSKLMHANFELAWLNAESGSPADALKSYQEAVDILEPEVASSASGDVSKRTELAIVFNNLGNLQVDLGRFDDARKIHAKALALREGVVRERPDDAGSLFDLSYSEHNLGWLETKCSNPDAAMTHFRRAVALREKVLSMGPANGARRAELATTLNNLGWVIASTGRKDEGRDIYRRGVALLEQSISEQPNVVSFRANLVDILCALGESLANELNFRAGFAEASASFARAQSLGEAIVSEVPTVPRYRSRLAMTLMQYGSLERNAKHFDRAIALHQKAVVLGEALARDHSDTLQHQLDLAGSLTHLGLTLVEADRAADALPLHERAAGIYEAISRKNSADIGTASLFAGAINNKAMALIALGRHGEAIEALRAAITHERECMERDPKTAQYRQWLSNHYLNLSRSLRALGRKEEALAVSRTRFELLRQAPPDQRDIAIHYHVACDMAQMLTVVGRGKRGSELTSAERAERESFAKTSVEEFRLTLADGFIDVPLFVTDKDLDPIRGRADFQSLLASAMDKTFPAQPYAPSR
jgi:tetratricopeptide (TPR) repeat protein